jgi:PAS domain S-box-containing protein
LDANTPVPAAAPPRRDGTPEQAEQFAALLLLARELLDAVSAGYDEGALLQIAVESAAKLIGARYGAIGILDEADAYRHFVHTGLAPQDAARIGSPPRGLGLLGAVIQSRSALRVDDISADPRSAGFPPHHPPMKTLLAVPLSSHGRAYGRLYLSERLDGQPFGAFDELLACHLGQYLSLALDRSHQIELYRERQADYHQGEERYRLLLDMAPGAVLVVQDGQVALANIGAMQIAGAARLSDVVGRSIEDFVHEESLPLARERMTAMLTQARLPKVQLRIRRFDGTTGWIEVEGARISYRGRPAILSVARDITKDKQDSASIRALHHMTEAVNRAASAGQVFDVALETLLATTSCSSAAIMLFDKRKALRFVAWNGFTDTFCAAVDGHLQWTPDTIPGAPLLFPDGVDLHELAHLDAHLRRQGVVSVAFVPVAQQGRSLGTFLLGFSQRHEPSEDEVRTALTIAEQVAVAVVRQWAVERMNRLNTELEDRVKRRTRQLEEANKELEAFAYSVSHDLRAPLRALNGYSRILLDDFAKSLDTTANHYLERIISASRRMEQLIDDLLRLSRVTRSHIDLRAVNLSDLVEDLLGKLRESAPERRVETVITPGLTVDADPGLMQIVLGNLLANAWKYTGRKTHARIEFGLTENQGKRAYFVADNGAGFDMSYAGKLFSPFQRLHPPSQFEGTGIGLALVSRIIRRFGGDIWAEASPNAGATFYFTVWEDGVPDELRKPVPDQ